MRTFWLLMVPRETFPQRVEGVNAETQKVVQENGAGARNRTADLRVTNEENSKDATD